MSRSARAENLYTNEHLVSTCCEFFFNASLRNSVFVLFKLKVCPLFCEKKLTARENWTFIGVEICHTSQGQTLFYEKRFFDKCTRAMEQREAATGLSEAREAADR